MITTVQSAHQKAYAALIHNAQSFMDAYVLETGICLEMISHSSGLITIGPDTSCTLLTVVGQVTITAKQCRILCSLYAYSSLVQSAWESEHYNLHRECMTTCESLSALADYELNLLYSQLYNGADADMFDYKTHDQERFGDNVVYHHKFKRGNHRYDTYVFLKDGFYAAVYRQSYSKKVEGVKKSFINDEKIVGPFEKVDFINAEFPEHVETDKLKKSDFFKGLKSDMHL